MYLKFLLPASSKHWWVKNLIAARNKPKGKKLVFKWPGINILVWTCRSRCYIITKIEVNRFWVLSVGTIFILLWKLDESVWQMDLTLSILGKKKNNNNMKTCLYNFDPFKPHFYVVKLWFTGYTLFFLFLLKNVDCGYSLEPPSRDGSNGYPQSMFCVEIWKISDFFYLKIFLFWL